MKREKSSKVKNNLCDAFKTTSKHSFTLAEILITLAIIGVVAAITIPSLVINYQKQTYVAGLKKFYSTMSQALVKMANDYGCPGDLKCTGVFDPNELDGYDELDEKSMAIIKKYLVSAAPVNITVHYKALKGTTDEGYVDPSTGIGFADGSYFTLSTDSSGDNCQSVIMASSVPACAAISVDVNGAKGPNQVGRDMFEFYILPNATIEPSGGKTGMSIDPERNWQTGTPNYNCRPEDGDTLGRSCSGRIMDEGWQMNY